MTCNDALRAMLDADLATVAAGDASPLGIHVAGCARCRAVVAGLLADTSRLAAIAARHPLPTVTVAPRVSRRATWLLPIPVAAVAVLAYVVFSHNAFHPTSIAASRMSVAPVASALEPPAAARATERAQATTHPVPRRVAASDEQTALRIEATRLAVPAPLATDGPVLAQAAPLAPVQIDAGLDAREQATVRVATTSGRAMVLRPSNASITVVWFY